MNNNRSRFSGINVKLNSNVNNVKSLNLTSSPVPNNPFVSVNLALNLSKYSRTPSQQFVAGSPLKAHANINTTPPIVNTCPKPTQDTPDPSNPIATNNTKLTFNSVTSQTQREVELQEIIERQKLQIQYLQQQVHHLKKQQTNAWPPSTQCNAEYKESNGEEKQCDTSETSQADPRPLSNEGQSDGIVSVIGGKVTVIPSIESLKKDLFPAVVHQSHVYQSKGLGIVRHRRLINPSLRRSTTTFERPKCVQRNAQHSKVNMPSFPPSCRGLPRPFKLNGGSSSLAKKRSVSCGLLDVVEE